MNKPSIVEVGQYWKGTKKDAFSYIGVVCDITDGQPLIEVVRVLYDPEQERPVGYRIKVVPSDQSITALLGQDEWVFSSKKEACHKCQTCLNYEAEQYSSRSSLV